MLRLPRKTPLLAALTGLGTVCCLQMAAAGIAGAAANSVDLKSSYQATIAATSAKETLHEVVDSAGKRVSVDGSGVADAHGNGSFTLHADGQTIAMVFDNGVLYMKVPASSASALGVTTPWISFNLSALEQATLGQSYAQLVSEAQQGPAQSLAILQTASSAGIRKVGTANLFGTSTTEYRTTVDLSKLSAASGKPALAPAIQQFETQYHVSSIPVEVWIDSHKRVRRLVEDIKVPTAGSTHASSVSVTVDITAFDVPLHITPPPAGQSTDETQKAISSSQT
jgi:hypothetical protein